MNAECRCGRPTRDAAYSCDGCGDLLARTLGDIPWLDEQLEVTITRQSGIDYRRMGSGGAKKDAERPLPGNWTASEARTHLKALLVLWTRMCDEEGVRSSDPREGLPDDNLVAISRWLLWRVDGLMLHEAGGDAVEEITSAVAHCHRLIDRAPDRQFLGDCHEVDCSGRLYARLGGEMARCDSCGTTTKADEIRKRVIAELDDRLCTAREIAELSTYLGLKAGRDQVRKYVEWLSRKGKIAKHPAFSDQAVYRFGEVYDLLLLRDYGAEKKQPA